MIETVEIKDRTAQSGPVVEHVVVTHPDDPQQVHVSKWNGKWRVIIEDRED